VQYLLDTNTCVQYLRKGSASPISARLANVKPSDIRLCTVVLAELLYGALRSRDVAKNLVDVRNIVAGFQSLVFDDAAAEEYAKIRADLASKGTPIGPNDLMIAAIALAHGLIVVTHNTAEFSRVAGLTLEDWQTP
jgi:tRNA(fMet)-specific endonuclease VapC